VPVTTPGTYFVDMFVAETRGAEPHQRVWNVTAEDRTVARSVDAAQMSGHDRAGHVLFFVPVVDGVLNLHVHALRGLPLVGALEVDWRKTATVDHTLFSDTFSGPAGQSPNGLRWGYDQGGNGWGNHEQQSYTTRPNNVSLDGTGHLSITARREKFTGGDGATRSFTSARIKTAGRFSFQYGTAAARIRVPSGAGLWPAFWALGTNFNTVGWPLCGELDVMENIGSQPRVTHASAHGGTARGAAWQSGGRLRMQAPLSWRYRTYRLTWGPSAVAMSVDGQTYSSVSNLDHPFYLLLNLAVGGDWPGPPKSSTPFPATMSVDSVKVRG
jgi:beta-glucanase (GH16 family)